MNQDAWLNVTEFHISLGEMCPLLGNIIKLRERQGYDKPGAQMLQGSFSLSLSHVCICACMFIGIYMYECVEAQAQLPVLFLNHHLFYVLTQGLSGLDPSKQARLAGHQDQGSPCLYFSCAGFISVPCCI